MPGAYVGTEGALTCYLGNDELGLSFIGQEAICIPDPAVNTAGWYTVIYNSDIYGDYDISTLHPVTPTTPYFYGLHNHILDTVTGTFTSSINWGDASFSTQAQGNILYADRDFNNQNITDFSERCILKFNKCQRTWDRIDNDDYYTYTVNQSSLYAHSLGVITSDPRFLAALYDQSDHDLIGILPAFPKRAYIWLNDGETLDTLPVYIPRTTPAPDGSLWGITCNGYDTSDEVALRQGIRDEFGPTAIPLDFNDMNAYHATYGHLDILLELPPVQYHSDGVTPRRYGGCTYNGVYTHSGTRKYYVSEEGKYYNNLFAVFGVIGAGEGIHGGSLLDLGSWYSVAMPHYIKVPSG